MLIAKRSLQKQLTGVSEWATAEIVRGLDTPHLRQLAGTTGTENPFELEELFDRTITELGIDKPSRKQAILVYAQELARDYLDGKTSKEFLLKELCQFCIATDYMRELYPFYELCWTFDDLKEQVFSFYRNDATRENFEEILGTEIEKLLSSPEK